MPSPAIREHLQAPPPLGIAEVLLVVPRFVDKLVLRDPPVSTRSTVGVFGQITVVSDSRSRCGIAVLPLENGHHRADPLRLSRLPVGSSARIIEEWGSALGRWRLAAAAHRKADWAGSHPVASPTSQCIFRQVSASSGNRRL